MLLARMHPCTTGTCSRLGARLLRAPPSAGALADRRRVSLAGGAGARHAVAADAAVARARRPPQVAGAAVLDPAPLLVLPHPLLLPVLAVLLAPLHLQLGVLQRRNQRVCTRAWLGELSEGARGAGGTRQRGRQQRRARLRTTHAYQLWTAAQLQGSVSGSAGRS
jgi:hypothetical protein